VQLPGQSGYDKLALERQINSSWF